MTLEKIKNQILHGKYNIENIREDLANIYGLTNTSYESGVWLIATNYTGDRGVYVLMDKYQELFNLIELIKLVKE